MEESAEEEEVEEGEEARCEATGDAFFTSASGENKPPTALRFSPWGGVRGENKDEDDEEDCEDPDDVWLWLRVGRFLPPLAEKELGSILAAVGQWQLVRGQRRKESGRDKC